MVGYTIVLFLTSQIFKRTIYVDLNYYYFWGILAVSIIYLLNKTIKPLLFWLTLPITGLTLGLFYPIINIIILKIVDLILLNHFEIHGIISLFFASIVISILNTLIENLVIKKIMRGIS